MLLLLSVISKCLLPRRRITESQMQHVVYREWLPVILGHKISAEYRLDPLHIGYTEYNASLDATVLNEFSSVAFRFGHSLVNNTFLRSVTEVSYVPVYKRSPN